MREPTQAPPTRLWFERYDWATGMFEWVEAPVIRAGIMLTVQRPDGGIDTADRDVLVRDGQVELFGGRRYYTDAGKAAWIAKLAAEKA